jgi:integrase
MPRSSSASLPKGVKIVRRRLAGGGEAVYFYWRASGELIGRTEEQARAWFEAKAAPGARPVPVTLADLIAAYRADDRWARLAPGTKRTYLPYLERLRERFGPYRLDAFDPAFVEKLKQSMRSTPRAANHMIALLRRLFNVAMKMGVPIVANPAEKPELFTQTPRRALWSPQDEGLFLAAVRELEVGGNPKRRTGAPRTRMQPLPPAFRLAHFLALYLLQRPDDVLSLAAGDVREDDSGRLWVKLRQRKTGALLEIPVLAALDAELRPVWRAKAPHEPLVATRTGARFSRHRFSKEWAKWRDAVQDRHGASLLSHLRFSDLRRTGMVRWAELGLSPLLISSVSGHEIDQTQAIIDTYVPRTRQMALAAVLSVERAEAQKAGRAKVKSRPHAVPLYPLPSAPPPSRSAEGSSPAEEPVPVAATPRRKARR